GGDEILDELALIAPVQAVYGNTDSPGDPRLVASIERVIGGLRVHVSHGHEVGSPTPARLLESYPADVIVYGHTHRQHVMRAADGRVVVNPGAAGARRFKLEPSVGVLTITDGHADVELIALD
ncbi:MAG: metallophosphoesterase family protein, partial [bacterium]